MTFDPQTWQRGSAPVASFALGAPASLCPNCDPVTAGKQGPIPSHSWLPLAFLWWFPEGRENFGASNASGVG